MALTRSLPDSTLSLTATSNPGPRASLATMPFDVQERIFEQIVLGSEFDQNVHRAIALLSKPWYKALIDSSLAWSRICFMATDNYQPMQYTGPPPSKLLTSVNELRRWLERAGSRPLRVSLRYYRLTGESLGDILRAMFAHANRIRRLYLAVDVSSCLMAYPGSIDLDEIANILSHPVHELQILALQHDLRIGDRPFYASTSGPSLASLFRGDIGHPWTALTTLELPESVFMDKILPAGPALIPAVRTIALHGSFLSSAPPSPNPPARVVYPNVRFLSLRISGVGTVLRRLTMPKLNVLMLGDARRVVSPQEWPAVCVFLQVSEARLSALYLDNVHITPASLVCTISQMPRLLRLVVANAQHTGDLVRRLVETRYVSCRVLEDLAVSPSPWWAQLEDISVSQNAAWTLAQIFNQTASGLQSCSMGEYELRNCYLEDERTWYWESEGTQTWWSALRFEQEFGLSLHAAELGAA